MLKLSDEQFDNFIGNQLRVGVIISAIVTLFGGILYLLANGSHIAQYQHFQHIPDELCNIKGIIRSAIQFNSLGIIQLGVLLLIATPVIRVALSIIGFMVQRDKVYVIITLIVLAVLSYSLINS